MVPSSLDGKSQTSVVIITKPYNNNNYYLCIILCFENGFHYFYGLKGH